MTPKTKKENEEKADLIRRAKEYAEYFEATRNFNTLGFFNDLIKHLESDNREGVSGEPV